MAAAARSLGVEKTVYVGKKGKWAERARFARVASGGAGEGGEGLMMTHSVWWWWLSGGGGHRDLRPPLL